MVEAFLALLRTVQQYLAFQQAVPELAAESAHRAVELLKVLVRSRMRSIV